MGYFELLVFIHFELKIFSNGWPFGIDNGVFCADEDDFDCLTLSVLPNLFDPNKDGEWLFCSGGPVDMLS